jgi:hypothetical protein
LAQSNAKHGDCRGDDGDDGDGGDGGGIWLFLQSSLVASVFFIMQKFGNVVGTPYDWFKV